jgi:hypothetical protein
MNGMQPVHVPWPSAGRGLLLGLTSLVSPAVLAQDAPAPTPTPEPPKIDVTGFVDVYCQYNFNKIDPALRSFDVQHDAFSLSVGVAGCAVNGWNNATDFSGKKTFGLGATLKPTASLTGVGTCMGGVTVEGGDTRHVFDTTLTLTRPRS